MGNPKLRKSLYLETKNVLEKSSDHVTVGMHLNSIPARVRNHNSWHTLDNWVIVAWHVDAKQTVSADLCIVLIDAFSCSTITHIVLGTSSNFCSVRSPQIIRIQELTNIRVNSSKDFTGTMKSITMNKDPPPLMMCFLFVKMDKIPQWNEGLWEWEIS